MTSQDSSQPNATTSMLLTGARVVLADRVIDSGWVDVTGGRIEAVGEGAPPRQGTDIGGDYLIPGLVELHTDHLETHIEPRPKVHWDPVSAVLAYDAQIAGSGITTVFDCIRLGTDGDNPDPDLTHVFAAAGALKELTDAGLSRAEHRTHLRCEVASENVVTAAEQFLAHHTAGILSIMDHTPGLRQFRDKDKLATYYRSKMNMGEMQLEEFFAERLALHEKNEARHREALVAIARRHGVTLASHDDTTLEHVAESQAHGAHIAEFPTTLEAARASHAAGISVLMGAPNIMLGGSHSGNVAARELAEAGVLDILSSDYVPGSLIQAAFRLPREVATIDLPSAIAMVTRTPAAAVGFDDRGEIAPGRRADLVRVHVHDGTAVVREVYREGRRVS